MAAGYQLVQHVDETLDCQNVVGSQVAVDNGIAACTPLADYVVACWAGPTVNTTLCFRNPFGKEVDLFTKNGSGPVGHPFATPSPFALVLSNGWRCTIRGGGAWGPLQGHPNWYGTYGCDNDKYALWGSGQSDGINRSGAVWTVPLSAFDGMGATQTVSIRTAYFVGDAR